MIGIATLCLFVSLGFQNAVGSPITEYDYSLEAGAGLRLHIVPATWSDAALLCQLEGGVLATPTSDKMLVNMLTAMKEHKVSSSSVFIGITDLLSKGKFKSVDGLYLGDTTPEWAPGEPDNAGGVEDCVALDGAGALADVNCARVLPYFCHNSGPQITNYNNKEASTENADRNPFELFGFNADEDSNDDAIDSTRYPTDSPRYNYDAVDVSREDTTYDINPSSQYKRYIHDYSYEDYVIETSSVDSSTVIPEYEDNVPAVTKLPQCSNDEYEYDYRTGSCYKFHRTAKLWRQALKICFDEGGHLAVINSDSESTVLEELFEKNPNSMMIDCEPLCNPNYASIGFRRWDDDEYATINGYELSAAGFAEWSPGEPNNFRGRENCGSIWRNGLLADIPCLTPFPFICEIKPKESWIGILSDNHKSKLFDSTLSVSTCITGVSCLPF